MWKILFLIGVATLVGCGEIPAGSGSLLVDTAQPASPPFGFGEYCRSAETSVGPAEQQFHAAFCHREAPPRVVRLTPERAHELVQVQEQVAATITYRSTTTWNPLASEGDCKTYVAQKELQLLARGWPAGALRIATAFVDDGSPQQFIYHAVLLVDTDRGTLVLDSRRPRLVWWDQLRYIWMTAQAHDGSQRWVRLPADAAAVKTALAAYGQHAEPGGGHDGRRYASGSAPLSLDN
ncbi:MAG: hypothetical protein JWL84_5757 [Rhodospirillales bacterium]|jgi:predicted transglutaminase-like cysteine proteinase|nr:hypothetical protein [Rhodospirillales bacterium]